MSDHDAAPDPMDKAYIQAEALLDDDAVRAARRARVLAAVAETAAEPQAAPAPSRTLWRRGGWLAAASVAGVSVFIAIQINRPPTFERPTASPAEEAPPAAGPTRETAALADSPEAPSVAPPEIRPAAQPSPEMAARARSAPALEETPRASAAPAIPPLPLPPVAPLPPPPVAATPPPPAPAGRLERRLGSAAAPARAQKPGGVDEVVVTGSRRPSATEDAPVRLEQPQAAQDVAVEELVTTAHRKASPAEAGARRLRDAAAEGRTRDISALLARGVPIDAVDGDGETALMKAVAAKQVDASALLRRRGASLDLKNHAGRSARDMAAALADPKLNKALGLDR